MESLSKRKDKEYILLSSLMKIFNTLLNLNGDPDEYFFLATGQIATDIADIHLVGFQEVVHAMKYFYQTRELSNDLDWE